MRRERRVGVHLSCRSIRDRALLAGFIALGITFTALGTMPARAAGPGLAELSLEELANIEITSVARRPERLSAAPASVYVITAEAIRRSGASTCRWKASS